MSTRAKRSLIEVVIDTNVFVSALTGGRITSRIYTALLKEAFTLILSPDLLSELIHTLTRPAFELRQDDIERVTAFLKLSARFIQPVHSVNACRDPTDNMVLEGALAGRADAIVTGDKDLLALHPFHGIPIISPRVFITQFLATA